MKPPSVILPALLVLSTTISPAEKGLLGGFGVVASPLHTGVDYQRYLLEKDEIGDELKAWMTKWNTTAQKNGWIPKPKSKNATDKDIDEDRRQRFFLAKQLVQRLKTENPKAEFSTDSPFTLLTTDEFAAYVKNSYIAGGGGARLLRTEADPAEPNAPTMRSVATAARPSMRSLAGNPMPPASSTPAATKPSVPAATVQTPAATRPTVSAPPVGAPARTTPAATRGPATTTVSPTAAPTKAPTSAPTTPAPTTTTKAPTTAPTVTSTPTPTPSTAAPSIVDWSAGKCMPPVQNQGQCGSCWAFASVAVVETAQCLSLNGTSFTKLSEQTLTSCDTRNSGCNGGVPLYAMQFIQQNGLCTLADDPYTAGSVVLASCNTACAKVKTGMKSVQSLAQTEPALLGALSLRPVVVAVQAGNDAWKQYKSGVLSACPSSTASIDHAVVAVGYDASTVKIRNSWSTSWGEAGYIRLARSTTSLGTCKIFQQMTAATF